MPRVLRVSIIPALGILFEVTVGQREDRCHDRELNDDLVENSRKQISCRHCVPAKKERDDDDEENDGADSEIEFQDANVKREDYRPDEFGTECDAAFFLIVAARHDHRMAVLLQNFFDFRILQRTAEFVFLVFDLRVKIFRKLLHDVVALRIGKAASYRVQIFFENLRSHVRPTFRKSETRPAQRGRPAAKFETREKPSNAPSPPTPDSPSQKTPRATAQALAPMRWLLGATRSVRDRCERFYGGHCANSAAAARCRRNLAPGPRSSPHRPPLRCRSSRTARRLRHTICDQRVACSLPPTISDRDESKFRHSAKSCSNTSWPSAERM